MDIHEYQAKAILAKFGMPVGLGELPYSPEQAVYRAQLRWHDQPGAIFTNAVEAAIANL